MHSNSAALKGGFYQLFKQRNRDRITRRHYKWLAFLPCDDQLEIMRSRLFIVFISLIGSALANLQAQNDSTGSAQQSNPIGSKIVKAEDSGFSLSVNGKAFKVKGAGGSGSQSLLAELGGNSIRTWGIDEKTGNLLDEAQKNGLKVTLGFWLGHVRHGFSYENFEQVTKQISELKSAVEKYKNHPALLMWSIGNEMEGFDDGDNPAIWMHIEHCAQMVKSLDPNHPIMTVTAEIGGRKVEAMNYFCPSVDIHGINSYGGITSVAERYRKAGGVKPYLITEYGIPGTWETKPGKWGMPEELSSTAKATFYKDAYAAADKDSLCLGSYAFTWGAKQEASATWFGMLLPSGERLATADAVSEMWTGKPVENQCPRIELLTLVGENKVLEPGAEIKFALKASDPENDKLNVHWILTEDWKEIAEGGDSRPSPPKFPESILESSAAGAKIKMPDGGGTYRVYVYLKDGNGGAATANVSLKVKGERKAALGSKIKLPLTITGGDPNAKQFFFSSGWMGDTDKMKLSLDSQENPKIGKTCLKLEFTEPAGWGGIVWQSPAGDWGDQPGGFDFTGAKKLTFWARGGKGGETAKFGFGIIKEDKLHFDTAREEISVTLKSEWEKFEIPLEGKNLRRIKSGFYLITEAKGLPFEFFVDEVVVE